jgi:hypothetical protein
MKISRNTKARIQRIKEESQQVRAALENLHARLEEHPGTKRMAHKLRRSIDYLAEWQRDSV